MAQAMAAAVIGGTASRLAGGKFANGAVTAAFGYAFNQLSHSRGFQENKDRWLGVGYDFEGAFDKVGHSFLIVRSLGGSVEQTYGFYPSIESVDDVIFSRDVPGVLATGDSHAYNIINSISSNSDIRYFRINEEQYNSMMSVINEYKSASYNLGNRNCTDFVIDAGRAAKVPFPASFGGSSRSWDTPADMRSWMNPKDLTGWGTM